MSAYPHPIAHMYRLASLAPAGLVARWTLDDAIAGYVDLVAGLTLTTNGVPPPGTGTGIINNGATFSGANALQVTSSLLRANSTFSAEAWIRSATPSGAIWCNRLDGVREILVRATGGAIEARLQGAAGLSVFSGPPTIAANTWHHVVLTYNAASSPRFSLYYDGSSVATDNTNVGPSLSGTVNMMGIGFDPNVELNYVGTIDEPAFWAVDLSADQVVTRYNSGAGRRP